MPEPFSKYAYFDIFINKLLKHFSSFLINKNINISPNFITLLQLPILYILLILSNIKHKAGTFICLLLGGLLDNLDGIHARNSRQESKLGMYLDHYVDILTAICTQFILFRIYFNINFLLNIVISSLVPLYFLINCSPDHNLKETIFIFFHDNTVLLKFFIYFLWFIKI
jgi:phosphatidylglycerophosphate synthase